jgi:hypothetical protein
MGKNLKQRLNKFPQQSFVECRGKKLSAEVAETAEELPARFARRRRAISPSASTAESPLIFLLDPTGSG